MEDRAASCAEFFSTPFPELLDCLQAGLFLHIISPEDVARDRAEAYERARDTLTRYENQGLIPRPGRIARRKLYRKSVLLEAIARREAEANGEGSPWCVRNSGACPCCNTAEPQGRRAVG